MRVYQLENKNQFVIMDYESNKIAFQSYDSVCAEIKDEVLTLGRDWDYSKTTLKHLYIFLDYHYYRLWDKIKDSKNKRALIQKMIDNGEINYNEDMR